MKIPRNMLKAEDAFSHRKCKILFLVWLIFMDHLGLDDDDDDYDDAVWFNSNTILYSFFP